MSSPTCAAKTAFSQGGHRFSGGGGSALELDLRIAENSWKRLLAHAVSPRECGPNFRESIRVSLRELLISYPRERAPLSKAHQEIYAQQYKINREGSTLVDNAAQNLEKWMHRQISTIRGAPVLEIGAGTLNHMKFETAADSYDIVEPFVDLYRGRPELARVRAIFESVRAVPTENRYRRIVSIAVLEHLTDLPGDVAQSALLLDDQGLFQAGIPSEGGLLWWLAWRFSTGLAYFVRTGLDYGVVMRHEHVNNANEIIAIVRHFFEDVRIRRFPTPFHHASFYSYLEAQRPRRDLASAFLAGGA